MPSAFGPRTKGGLPASLTGFMFLSNNTDDCLKQAKNITAMSQNSRGQLFNLTNYYFAQIE
jgi:hypothetical protein